MSRPHNASSSINSSNALATTWCSCVTKARGHRPWAIGRYASTHYRSGLGPPGCLGERPASCLRLGAPWHAACGYGGSTEENERSQPMLNPTLVKERQALLALELASEGVDLHRLGFLRWLIENQQDPEWCLQDGELGSQTIF